MRTITKLRRSTKGLSPIFATLILIAIAVIAGIVVYMFTSGFIGSLTGQSATGQEKAAVQSASGSGTVVTVYAQYVAGGSNIAINGAIIKDSDGTTIQGTVAGSLLTTGALTKLDVTATSPLTAGHVYSVTLTSSKGGSFVSPAFTAGVAPSPS
jgi:archaeal type IV pilus assembly protein PilA